MDTAAKTNAAVDDFRVVAPEFLSGACIDSKRDTPVRDCIKNTVCEKWRRFLVPAAVSDLDRPRQAKAANVRRIDFF